MTGPYSSNPGLSSSLPCASDVLLTCPTDWLALHQHSGLCHFVVAPIISGGRVLGLLVVADTMKDKLKDERCVRYICIKYMSDAPSVWHY